LRFDPVLSTEDEATLSVEFADPDTACNMPDIPAGETYMIKDIWDSDWRDALAIELECDVILWFPKSAPEVPNPDRIAVTFSKTLSVQERKAF